VSAAGSASSGFNRFDGGAEKPLKRLNLAVEPFTRLKPGANETHRLSAH
jgi:hypothetical protein